MDNTDNLTYIHTRLQTNSSTIFIAVNEVEHILEQQNPCIILDDEILKEETRMSIDMKTYNILKDYFESLYGKKLPKIDIDNLEIFCCFPIASLENVHSFVSIIGYDEKGISKYLLVLTDKNSGSEYSVEISKEVYEALFEYWDK